MVVSSTERKDIFVQKLNKLLDAYHNILLVEANFVTATSMNKIRAQLRTLGGVVLMGKNTVIRKVIRQRLDKQPEYNSLLDLIVGNVGLVFCKDDTFADVKKIFDTNKIGANAKAGLIAPNDVTVPAGDTGLDPSQTAFMQALNIATKINKGQVSIINDVLLLKAGDKVGASEATLLQKLKITPFTYGLIVKTVYESGSLRDPKSLDVTEADVLRAMATGIANVKALSLGACFPTQASVPTLMSLGYKNVSAVALATAYDPTYKPLAALKKLMNDPEALKKAQAAAAAAPAAAAAAAPAAAKKADEKPKKVVEEKKEEEEDMGLGLFD